MSFLQGIFGKIAVGISTLLISVAGFIAPSHNTAVVPVNTSTTTVSVVADTQISASTTEIKTPSAPQTKQPVAKTTTTVTTSPTPKPADTPKASTPVVVAAVDNPAAACLPTKKDWDAFVVARSSFESKLSSLITTYKGLTNGTTNSPSDPLPYFTYIYDRMTAGKTSFTSQADTLRKVIDTLPKPPTATDDEFQKIKDAYSSAISDLQMSYDIAYQAAGVIATDKDGYIGGNQLTSAQSLENDSQDAYKKVMGTDVANVAAVIATLQKNLTVAQPNGCIYSFAGAGTKIWTTTKDERTFSQSQPSVSSNQASTEVTVAITTNLPIQINDNGSIKTVMKLNCFNNYYPPIQVVAGFNAVSGLVEKSKMTGDKCTFIYSGNGDDFSTAVATMPW